MFEINHNSNTLCSTRTCPFLYTLWSNRKVTALIVPLQSIACRTKKFGKKRGSRNGYRPTFSPNVKARTVVVLTSTLTGTSRTSHAVISTSDCVMYSSFHSKNFYKLHARALLPIASPGGVRRQANKLSQHGGVFTHWMAVDLTSTDGWWTKCQLSKAF